ncbi:MAG TPA: hypothetical protein VF766_02980 [Pyrinomonadaceae bacterium]
MKRFILTILLGCLLVATYGAKVSAKRFALTSEDVPTVEYCELVRNPSLYDGKKIRLHGVYLVSGKNDSKLFSSACGGGDTLWVDFEAGYQSYSPSKVVKSLATMSRKSGIRWLRPHVTVIGIEYRSAEVVFVGNFKAANSHQRPKPVGDTESPFSYVPETREKYDYVFSVSCVEKVKPLSKGAKY